MCGTGTGVAALEPVENPMVFAAAAGALFGLIILRRTMRHARRIDLDPVSAQWLGEQKRHRQS